MKETEEDEGKAPAAAKKNTPPPEAEAHSGRRADVPEPGDSAKASRNVFESDDIPRAILALAIPTVISQLVTTVYNLADTFWVGRLDSPGQLAALTVVFPTQLCMTALGCLFGIGAGTCMARSLGAGKVERAHVASAFAFHGAVLSGLAFALAAAFFRPAFHLALGSTAPIQGYVDDYLDYALCLGAVPTVANIALANLLRGEGRSREAGIGLSLGGLLNIALDPFFVLPSGLGLEIKGAALATLASTLASGAYFAIVLARGGKGTHVRLSPSLLRDRDLGAIGLDVVLTGLPGALQTLLSAVSNLVLNGLMIGHGEVAEAAVGITKKIDAIPFCIVNGLSMGTAPLVAYDFGAGRTERMRRTMKTALGYCVGVALAILLGVEVFANDLVGAFTGDAETVRLGAGFLRLHCLSMPLIAVTFMMVAFFQSVGAKASATALSVVRKGVVDIPLMFPMDALLPMQGLVACQPITDFVSAAVGIAMLARWRRALGRQAGKGREYPPSRRLRGT